MDGQDVKEWRSRAGLTQQQLAERLGVATNTVARWERDEVSAPPFLDLTLHKFRREKLPDYIRRVMKENSQSIVEVSETAKRCGHHLSRSLIHELMKGHTVDPKVSTIRALAAGLNRPVEELLQALGFGVSEGPRDPELELIQINYSRLPESKRREFKFVVKMLSREIQRLLKE